MRLLSRVVGQSFVGRKTFLSYLWICWWAVAHSFTALEPDCVDLHDNCRQWVLRDSDQCFLTDFIRNSCLRSCGICMTLPAKYDVRNLSDRLKPLDWLVGIWRSENGGKAFFPTIPNFTYGEQIEISIADSENNSFVQSLNYTTFAWGMERKHEELHSESGFLTVSETDETVALTTVMSNGFVTVEEGKYLKQRIRFSLIDIGRISFSRDLPVIDVIREWNLLDEHHLEARLQMETMTHNLREHTTIIYRKIFP